jgi:uracil-DNA glycosylase
MDKDQTYENLCADLKQCQVCAERFAQTQTAHHPRPVLWFHPNAKVLIAGQAPGRLVHQTGRPFTDPSGDRLRDWLGLSHAQFYDQTRIAIVPMAFCFPGYSSKGADLPPPRICARLWRARVMAHLHNIKLTLLVGSYAIKQHLGAAAQVGMTVRAQSYADQEILTLPHPSWRNTAWLRKNPWFEAEVLPVVRGRLGEVLGHE